MKSIIAYTFLAALLQPEAIAQPGGPGGFGGGWGGDFPSCASGCAPQWDGATCTGTNQNSWGDCICNNATMIANVNSCVDTSTCSADDKSSIYQKIASLCAAAGETLTAAPEASFTGSALTSWSGGPWTSGGPFNGGPFGNGVDSSWSSGAWTSWWGGAGPGGCPSSDWTGWTSGTWSKNAPWTSWAACTATTTATTTFTTTDTAGAVVTATGFAVQVAEATQTGAASILSFEALFAALAGMLVVAVVVL